MTRPLPRPGAVTGIHHVTAIARDAQRNVDFYTGLLGLRLVKRTVNFDDPGTYHLYYGDEVGAPGTLLTFFPWAYARLGSTGTGQTTRIALRVGGSGLGYWKDRLKAAGVTSDEIATPLGETVLRFGDPDGLGLEIVADDTDGPNAPWRGSGIPGSVAVRGIHGVTLTEREVEPAVEFLSERLGMTRTATAPGVVRFTGAAGPQGGYVDIVDGASAGPGRVAAGTVHHLALRVPDAAAQDTWRGWLSRRGLEPTPPQDRMYFRSIYFREPGGVLLEIATDPPGFTADETAAELGTQLRLPPWLERARPHIEAMLPHLELPRPAEVAP